jgi:hypothetical protein
MYQGNSLVCHPLSSCLSKCAIELVRLGVKESVALVTWAVLPATRKGAMSIGVCGLSSDKQTNKQAKQEMAKASYGNMQMVSEEEKIVNTGY